MLTEILLFIIVAICIFHYCTRCTRIGKLVENIPGPPNYPLVGGIISLMGNQEEIWLKFRKMTNGYYPIFKFWTPTEVIINIRHPDDIETLLSSTHHSDKCSLYRFLEPWLKKGLLTSNGSKWQTRRKILTPAFHFSILQKYLDIVIENNEKFIKTLKTEADEIYVPNLLQFVSTHTLNIICEAAMGVSLHEMKESQEKYKDAVHKIGDILYYRLTRPWFHNDTLFDWSSKGHEHAEALNVLHGFSKKIISERKEYHKKTNGHYLNQLTSNEINNDDDEIFGMRKKRLAMLDLLIASSINDSAIDDNGIQEEVDTFIFAGYDTTAVGLTFILLLLAEHEDVQARVRDEVNDVLRKSDGKIGYSEIQQFTYLEMCIKESLRLYPSVPIISRQINQDIQLREHLIPKGAIMNVHIFDVHRDASFWSEPNKFDPERFLPEKIKDRHPFSYIPFSAGSRNCIGQRFAMMELKVTIAYLLRNFELKAIDLAHEIPLAADMVTKTVRPIQIKLVSIKSP